jgi:hypothetical protein
MAIRRPFPRQRVNGARLTSTANLHAKKAQTTCCDCPLRDGIFGYCDWTTILLDALFLGSAYGEQV